MTDSNSPIRHEISVLDSTMSYVEAGSGGPAALPPWQSDLVLHWRNIIPHVAPMHDHRSGLIGYGQSGKPDIEYRFVDHVRYLDAFIDALDLREIVLVAQDLGTARVPLRRAPAGVGDRPRVHGIHSADTSWDDSSEAAGSRLVQSLQVPGPR